MIVYFELSLRHKNANSCLCDDCYLCPFEKCVRFPLGERRARATPQAIKWAQAKHPKTFTLTRIIEEKEGELDGISGFEIGKAVVRTAN